MTEVESCEVINVIGSGVITKPGQKYPTPSPGNGDRVFYESLLEQDPESHMAQEWCVFYGVLPDEQATKLLAIVLKRKGVVATASQSPVKAAAPKKATASPASKAAAKKTAPKKAAKESPKAKAKPAAKKSATKKK